MNKKLSLLYTAAGFAAALLNAQALQEYWDFNNDSSGTGLTSVANSGDLGSSWNFNDPGSSANGSGLWVIAGNSGKITRKAPTSVYASPATTGRYRLEADFASWAIDSASVGDTWTLKLNQSGGGTAAQITFKVQSSSIVRIRLAANISGSLAYRDYDYDLTDTDGVSVAVEFDFDTDEASYYVADSLTETFTTGFSGSNIGQVIYSKGGSWSTEGSRLSLDSFGYRSVEVETPEPETPEPGASYPAEPGPLETWKDYWTFDTDSAGDSLSSIENSGVLDSTWNFPGAGGDVVGDDNTWSVLGDSGVFVRAVPGYGEYSVAPTTGRHRLEVALASWNFDAASEGDSLVVRLDESTAAGGDNIARIELRVNGGAVEIRQSTDLVSGSSYRTSNFNLAEAEGARVAIEFDFDTDTVYYMVNDAVISEFTDFDGVNIAALRYQKSGSWSTAASSVKIESMGWLTIAEDSTAIEYFTFDYEQSGDRLLEIDNSSSAGSDWNINGAGGDAADGAGAWVVTGNSGTLTRKLPAVVYASPVSTGRYRLEADFASWDFDEASVGDSFFLRLKESGSSGSTIAEIQLRVLSTSVVEIRQSGKFGSGASYRSANFTLTEAAGATAAIEFDFENNTASYMVNGVVTDVFTDFQGVDIGQLLYVKSGSWTTAASSLNLDSFGYRSVEVPSNDPNRKEYWDFEGDASGGSLGTIINSGDLGSAWDGNAAGGDSANGAGAWFVAGDAGIFTRKLPSNDTDEYTTPSSTGRFRFVIDFASWDMNAASVGDKLIFKLNESVGNGGSSIAQVIFEVKSDIVTLQWASTISDDSSSFRGENFPLSSTDGARMEVEFDFDNDVVTYYIDGVYKHRFTNFNGDDIGQLLYLKTGSWSTATSSLVIEEFGYVSVPSSQVIDQWNFSEADGTGPNDALSSNGVGLAPGSVNSELAQVSEGELLFGSDGTSGGVFTAIDLYEDPITTGIIETTFKVTAASFNNTYANYLNNNDVDSVLPARVGFRVQDRRDGNKNIGSVRLVYDPELNEFQALGSAFGSGEALPAVIQTGSPVLLEDITLRMLIDLNEPNIPGSYQLWFTYGSGDEQLAVFDGVVGEAFNGSTQIDVFGITQQITNGDTNWLAGDSVSIDDLVIQRSEPVQRPAILDIVHNGANAVLSFNTVNDFGYTIKASNTVDGNYTEIQSVTGDGTRQNYSDTRTGSFTEQFYIIEGDL